LGRLVPALIIPEGALERDSAERSKSMKSFLFLRGLPIGVLLVSMGIVRVVHAQNIEKFDVPGASETAPEAVNESGRIIGKFVNSDRSTHAFVRSPFGRLTTFDAPSTGDDPTWATTIPLAINAAGEIAGAVSGVHDGVLGGRGFVRDVHGRITEFDVAPGIVETRAQTINDQGWVGGTFVDASYQQHGFVRSPWGAIRTFEMPAIVPFVRQVRPNGTVIGVSEQPLGFFHGFVREPNGTVSIFEGPDLNPAAGGLVCPRCGGTLVTAATASGESVGYYVADYNIIRGFVRRLDGTVSNLDVPGATSTWPEALNLEGSIAGEYTSPAPVGSRNFLLLRNGTLESFDVPGGDLVQVSALDSENRVIGTFTDAAGRHGFIRRPRAACGHFHF